MKDSNFLKRKFKLIWCYSFSRCW